MTYVHIHDILYLSGREEVMKMKKPSDEMKSWIELIATILTAVGAVLAGIASIIQLFK